MVSGRVGYYSPMGAISLSLGSYAHRTRTGLPRKAELHPSLSPPSTEDAVRARGDGVIVRRSHQGQDPLQQPDTFLKARRKCDTLDSESLSLRLTGSCPTPPFSSSQPQKCLHYSVNFGAKLLFGVCGFEGGARKEEKPRCRQSAHVSLPAATRGLGCLFPPSWWQPHVCGVSTKSQRAQCLKLVMVRS